MVTNFFSIKIEDQSEFGKKIIRTLVQQLEGELVEQNEDNFEITIRFDQQNSG